MELFGFANLGLNFELLRNSKTRKKNSSFRTRKFGPTLKRVKSIALAPPPPPEGDGKKQRIRGDLHLPIEVPSVHDADQDDNGAALGGLAVGVAVVAADVGAGRSVAPVAEPAAGMLAQWGGARVHRAARRRSGEGGGEGKQMPTKPI